eukprot:GILJ01007646.1.p1 GENE.GILJ01007646.1~~GILJ01007646.1.p1  ORF type:complete len:267 (-),score=22.95 GILJ01007646.1:2-802(-)
MSIRLVALSLSHRAPTMAARTSLRSIHLLPSTVFNTSVQPTLWKYSSVRPSSQAVVAQHVPSDLTHAVDAAETDPTKPVLIFSSKLRGSMLRLLKTISFGSATTSLLVAPALILADSNVSSMLRVIAGVVTCFLGCTSTGVMHVVAKPYVARLEFIPAENTVLITTVNLIGRFTQTPAKVTDIEEYKHSWFPFCNFRHKESGRMYYIDPMGNIEHQEHFRNVFPVVRRWNEEEATPPKQEVQVETETEGETTTTPTTAAATTTSDY